MESALKTIEQFAPDVVPSLLIPMAGRTLLAPTVSVAEMVSYDAPEAISDAPDWLLGFFNWRDVKVPLLSFEILCGETLPELQSKSRIAVFNNTGVSPDLPFIAVPTQGIPKLVRVVEDDISMLEDRSCRTFERMHVTLSGEELLIPDISALEQVYLDWHNGVAS